LYTLFSIPARPTYIVKIPVKTPSKPETLIMVAFPVNVPIASRKNSTVSPIKTSCSTSHVVSAHMNVPSATNPHSAKYAVSRFAVGASASPIFGRIRRLVRVSQKNPRDRNMVVPKVLPFVHSMIPIRSRRLPVKIPIGGMTEPRLKYPILLTLSRTNVMPEAICAKLAGSRSYPRVAHA